MRKVSEEQTITVDFIVFDDGKGTKVPTSHIQQFLEDAEDLESTLEYCEKYGFSGNNITDRHVYADHAWEKRLYAVLFDKNVLMYLNNRVPSPGENPKYMLGQGYRAFVKDFYALAYD